MTERKQDKHQFLEWLGRDLDAIDAQLDQWRAEYRNESNMGAKFSTDDKLAVLERRREEIRRRSRELEDFEGEDWERARRELEQARDDLKRSLARARNQTMH